MKFNFLLVFLTLLISYSCNEKTTYINYGEDINSQISYFESIEKYMKGFKRSIKGLGKV